MYLPKLLISLLALASSMATATTPQDRPDWRRFFEQFDAEGTLVILDARNGSRDLHVHHPERASTRFCPASTFKIPHTLFALDAGVLRDEFQPFTWDGVARTFPSHNQNQDLRSAMRNSAVWVYEGFGQAIGMEKANDYLEQIKYGNASTSGDPAVYWLDGSLAISAHEQIAFLERLYRNQLPFKVEHQRLVKDVILIEAGRDWILRGKTGWEGTMGWWVGWVEWPNGPVFFALNIDTPNRTADLAKREQITRAVLRSMDALPEI